MFTNLESQEPFIGWPFAFYSVKGIPYPTVHCSLIHSLTNSNSSSFGLNGLSCYFLSIYFIEEIA
jgi:hypothetical protein